MNFSTDFQPMYSSWASDQIVACNSNFYAVLNAYASFAYFMSYNKVFIFKGHPNQIATRCLYFMGVLTVLELPLSLSDKCNLCQVALAIS